MNFRSLVLALGLTSSTFLDACAADDGAATTADDTAEEPGSAQQDAGSDARDGTEPYVVGAGDGEYLYDPTRVAELVIEVSEESLATLRADADQAMGFEDFSYVPARVTFDGNVFERVGLRVKGNNSRATAQGDAVPFKLDMNRYVAGLALDGQTKINLHNNVNQPAAMNDYLSYAAFRDYGIAASRTGWADVSLNGQKLGLYTLVEQVNEKMLARFYEQPEAALYKPEPATGYLGYLGDDFTQYTTANYEADAEIDHTTFLRMVKTLAEEPVAAWDAVIDIESVLTYFAGNVALGNWDTYVAMGHNYYLFEASPGRLVMLPWDMNLSQAATSAVCPADLQRGGGGAEGLGGGPGGAGGAVPGLNPNALPGDGTIPTRAPNGPGALSREAPLHDGLMADASYHARYLELLADFLRGPGSATALAARIDAAASALGERVTESAIRELRSVIETRVAAIEAAIPSTPTCSGVSD